ncbi:MAG: DUF6077 domain-containing protein [Actinobacteria bacterium]|nr:DUF6077 domain-containing protein [Actinomycetota bacterium]
MPDYEEAKNVPNSRVRQLDGPIVALGAAALILVGPLRGAFDDYPAVPFASTLFLFLVPGVLLAYWFLGERFRGAALVPVGFVISTGVFGLMGVPLLMLHLSLEAYMWVIGAVLSAFLTAAMFRVALRKPPARRENDAPAGPAPTWLWVPFVLLGSALAFVSRARVPHPYNDIWVYLAYVREFLSTDDLALYEPYFGRVTELSRAQINGWLLVQASLSQISGIDPVELALRYLAPTLVIVALLAFYTLARTLFKSEAAALLAGCLCALFFLIHLSPSLSTFGGEFIGRIAEDKFVARFLFLPISLAFAFVYLEDRKLRYLGAFAFTCWSVMAMHPVGLAIIGLSIAGFGLVHVALNWRKREAWAKVAGLAAALLSVLLIPAVYVLATGNSLTAFLESADINSNDPDVLANMAFVRPEWKHVYEIGDGSYIMHPSLVLDPVILGSLLLGVPFLLWRLKSSLAAQLLLGVLFISVLVCYVPPVATFVGDNIVLPGQLWRLAWPIPLAALLTGGWMAWEVSRRVEAYLRRFGFVRRVARFVPLALVVVLAAVAAPTAVAGADNIYRTDEEVAQVKRSCFDPIFYWMRDNIREPSVVLAPDLENTCIPAYSASANVVSLRGGLILEVLPDLEERTDGRVEVPQGALDVQAFFSHPTFEEVSLILRRYDVDYVVVPTKKPRLNARLRSLPGIITTDSPGQGYALYVVDHRRLDEYLNRT